MCAQHSAAEDVAPQPAKERRVAQVQAGGDAGVDSQGFDGHPFLLAARLHTLRKITRAAHP